jgi:hypothetical protein
MPQYRILRVPLPVPLVQDIDRIIETGKAGYASRAEFVRDAVEAMALEVLYGEGDSVPDSKARTSFAPPSSDTGDHRRDHAAVPVAAAGISSVSSNTVLGSCPPCVLIANGAAEVVDEPLFGLHNRDYPSLWVARQLAAMTATENIPAQDFYAAVSQAAWSYGETLLALERATGKKLTALFPTNRAKPESSEGAFVNFALGSYRHDAGRIRASGPLFVWRLAQLRQENGRLLIGLTLEGHALLDDLADVSLDMPHERDHALRFLRHLRQFASRDLEGLEETLRMIARGLSRRHLVKEISTAHSEWTETVASTNAAGYVARAREWGLVAPHQAQGKYVLTDFGSEFLESNTGGGYVGN